MCNKMGGIYTVLSTRAKTLGNLVGGKGYSFAYMTIAIIMAVFAIVALPVVSKAEKK